MSLRTRVTPRRGGLRHRVVPGGVRFRLADQSRTYAEVRVWLDLEHHVEPPAARSSGSGVGDDAAAPPGAAGGVSVPSSPPDGSEAMICDPANSRRVPTAVRRPFGHRVPWVQAPAWLAAAAGPTAKRSGSPCAATGLRRTIAVTVWSPAGVRLARIRCRSSLSTTAPSSPSSPRHTQFSAAMIALGRLPAHRLALLSPGTPGQLVFRLARLCPRAAPVRAARGAQRRRRRDPRRCSPG